MSSSDFVLAEYRDNAICIVLPQHLRLNREEIGTGNAFEIGYLSSRDQREHKNQESIIIKLSRPGSPLAKQMAGLLLVPVRPPNATVMCGPSEILAGALQRITIVPQRDYFEMQFAYSDPRAEISIRITGRGKYDTYSSMWTEVVRSLKLLPTFKFEHRRNRAPLSSSSTQLDCSIALDRSARNDRFQQWIDELPSELRFLQSAIVDIARQSISDAEDADISLLRSIVVQRLPPRSSQAKVVLEQWFTSYDNWIRPRRTATTEGLMAFEIVHGALFGFANFGV